MTCEFKITNKRGDSVELPSSLEKTNISNLKEFLDYLESGDVTLEQINEIIKLVKDNSTNLKFNFSNIDFKNIVGAISLKNFLLYHYKTSPNTKLDSIFFEMSNLLTKDLTNVKILVSDAKDPANFSDFSNSIIVFNEKEIKNYSLPTKLKKWIDYKMFLLIPKGSVNSAEEATAKAVYNLVKDYVDNNTVVSANIKLISDTLFKGKYLKELTTLYSYLNTIKADINIKTPYSGKKLEDLDIFDRKVINTYADLVKPGNKEIYYGKTISKEIEDLDILQPGTLLRIDKDALYPVYAIFLNTYLDKNGEKRVRVYTKDGNTVNLPIEEILVTKIDGNSVTEVIQVKPIDIDKKIIITAEDKKILNKKQNLIEVSSLSNEDKLAFLQSLQLGDSFKYLSEKGQTYFGNVVKATETKLIVLTKKGLKTFVINSNFLTNLTAILKNKHYSEKVTEDLTDFSDSDYRKANAKYITSYKINEAGKSITNIDKLAFILTGDIVTYKESTSGALISSVVVFATEDSLFVEQLTQKGGTVINKIPKSAVVVTYSDLTAIKEQIDTGNLLKISNSVYFNKSKKNPSQIWSIKDRLTFNIYENVQNSAFSQTIQETLNIGDGFIIENKENPEINIITGFVGLNYKVAVFKNGLLSFEKLIPKNSSFSHFLTRDSKLMWDKYLVGINEIVTGSEQEMLLINPEQKTKVKYVLNSDATIDVSKIKKKIPDAFLIKEENFVAETMIDATKQYKFANGTTPKKLSDESFDLFAIKSNQTMFMKRTTGLKLIKDTPNKSFAELEKLFYTGTYISLLGDDHNYRIEHYDSNTGMTVSYAEEDLLNGGVVRSFTKFIPKTDLLKKDGHNIFYFYVPLSSSFILNKLSNMDTFKTDEIKLDDKIDVLNELINKLKTEFNIDVVQLDLVEKGPSKVFLENGVIYIDKKRISLADPLHEFMHFFLGALKNSDFQTYYKLLTSMENSLSENDLIEYKKAVQSEMYKDLTNLDKLEEIFVRYFADTLAEIYELNPENDLKNVLLDMFSVVINPIIALNTDENLKELVKTPLVDFLNKFGSKMLVLEESMKEAVTIENRLTNYKKDLKKNNNLKENCNGM